MSVDKIYYDRFDYVKRGQYLLRKSLGVFQLYLVANAINFDDLINKNIYTFVNTKIFSNILFYCLLIGHCFGITPVR